MPDPTILPDDQYNARWLARLASKSVPGENGCIEVANVFHNEDGYATMHHRSLGQFAHRVATILKGRPIPKGKMACHDCGNHGCVNDAHIYVGTMKQNARDTVNHGRHLEANKTECIHGHPFDEANTWICKNGKRHCRTCARINCRVANGWTREEAEALPKFAQGDRTPRRDFSKGRRRPRREVPSEAERVG